MRSISNRIDQSITVPASGVGSASKAIDLLSFKQYKIILFGINISLFRLPADNSFEMTQFDEGFVLSLTPYTSSQLGLDGVIAENAITQNNYWTKFYHWNDDRFKNEQIVFNEPLFFENNEAHYFTQFLFNYNNTSPLTFKTRAVITLYLEIYENWINNQKRFFKEYLDIVNTKLENIDYKVNSILLK